MEAALAEPEVATTYRLKEQMQIILNQENVKISLRNEIEKYINASHVPFRLIKEIHDVISDSGD